MLSQVWMALPVVLLGCGAGLGWAGLILLLKLGHHLEIILGSLWNLSDLSWLCTRVCIGPDLCCVCAH